jgi:hypothetical protein
MRQFDLALKEEKHLRRDENKFAAKVNFSVFGPEKREKKTKSPDAPKKSSIEARSALKIIKYSMSFKFLGFFVHTTTLGDYLRATRRFSRHFTSPAVQTASSEPASCW